MRMKCHFWYVDNLSSLPLQPSFSTMIELSLDRDCTGPRKSNSNNWSGCERAVHGYSHRGWGSTYSSLSDIAFWKRTLGCDGGMLDMEYFFYHNQIIKLPHPKALSLFHWWSDFPQILIMNSHCPNLSSDGHDCLLIPKAGQAVPIQ